ncbi:hypothetical protein F3J17_04905 [Burkholderia sp. Ax-1719]|nr:hypothetical protein [Burkholderia sp. Ax-1719]
MTIRTTAIRQLARRDLTAVPPDQEVGVLPGGSKVIAVSVAKGRDLLSTIDDYVLRQTHFDRQARLGLRREVVEVTQPIYLDYVASQVLSWTDDEISALKHIVIGLATFFAPLDLNLPPIIYVVKTSGQEEGYAAYTRRKDTIVLPTNMVVSVATSISYGDPLHPDTDLSYLQDVMVHECFHLFSKNHPSKRLALYERIHYRSTGHVVELPDAPWGPPTSRATMRDLKITNPDEPDQDVYIEMSVPAHPDDPSSPTTQRCLMPLLLAREPYAGGVFFEYLEWWFMAIAPTPSGRWEPQLNDQGQPLLYASAPLMQQYLSLVTANFTQEIFQPDEVLAQNFVLAATQPSLNILQDIQRELAAEGNRA